MGSDAHDDDNDADDHEKDEAQDEFVRGHATHKRAHLKKAGGRGEGIRGS